ncbi:hypothetical protein Dimus_028343 [Dionaea muscipula]
MATKLLLSFLVSFIYLSTILSLAQEVERWCNETPYPDTCKHYLGGYESGLATMQKSDFQKTGLRMAMNSAVVAHAHSQGLGPSCRNKREKAALVDCVSLLEDTVFQLNKTQVECTGFDQQTWLSAALTNIETCKTGYVDFGVIADDVLHLMFQFNNNVSKLISNSLAFNGKYNINNLNSNSNSNSNHNNKNKKAMMTTTFEDGFPTWVSRHDRKLLQSSTAAASSADLVVAQDGSGNYKTIGEALTAAGSRNGNGRFVIHVKAGVYTENFLSTKSNNIMLVGDGLANTIITGSKSVGGGTTTFRSATFVTTGDGFIAQGITFRNAAGPAKHQAVALRSGSDLSVFYECGFEGYQDTLYTYSQRQFFKNCNIYGTVDFIFGDAAVVFQGCNIYVRRPLASQKNTVTAQGRTDPNENTGIVIHDCTITAASDLKPVVGSFPSYLGRPWQQYSRTVVMETYIDNVIVPAGWLEWDGSFGLSTLFYGEYENTGPGSSTSGRVKWGGYKVITTATEATKYSVGTFIAGNFWLPATGVPFTAGI